MNRRQFLKTMVSAAVAVAVAPVVKFAPEPEQERDYSGIRLVESDFIRELRSFPDSSHDDHLQGILSGSIGRYEGFTFYN